MSSHYEWISGSSIPDAEWDDLVLYANDGTIFQSRQFLSYHPSGKFLDGSLALTKKGNLAAVFPAAIRERKSPDGQTEKWLVSHPGASYGGIIGRKIAAFDEAMTIGELLLAKIRESGYRGVEITPPPLAYHAVPSDVWHFTMMQLGFQYRKRDYTQVVPLWIGDVSNHYDNKSRGAMRFAEAAGVVVEEVTLTAENWGIFHPMLVENRKKHGVTPAHSYDDLIRLTELIPESLRLYFAFDSDRKVVAGTLIFIANPRIHLTFYIAHDRSREDLKAVIPLNHHSISQAQAAKATWLDFGISTVNGVPGPGLIRFKENFGAVGGWRDVYYYEVA